MSSSPWRVLPLFKGAGAVQMAIDLWLLQQHQAGHPSTLRFYTWSPIALSLGYHQRQIPEHWLNQQWNGGAIDLVRRPSGGRAVLHGGDLTYAVVTSGLARQRLQAYQQICQFLLVGWRSLGLPLSYGTAGKGYIDRSSCFGTSTTADLVTSSGEKFIGSAQLRRGETILQHGSMRLQPDLELERQLFGEALPSSVPVLPKDLRNLSTDQQHDRIIQALTQALEDVFQVQTVWQPLSPSEWEVIYAIADKTCFKTSSRMGLLK